MKIESLRLPNEEMHMCATFLKDNGRLRDFITSAPLLEYLTIQFDCNSPTLMARLSDLVGDFPWPSLQLAACKMISTTEEELMDFYERHTRTLREIRIESMHLDHGSWTSIFERIRDTLSLEKATVCGYLTIEDLSQSGYYGPPPECRSSGDSLGLGAVIEAYLVRGTGPVDVQD